jgi:hypothetical protein
MTPTPFSRRLRPLLAGLLAVASLRAAAARGAYEDPQPTLDRCWLVLSATTQTLGLFHLDEHASLVSKRQLAAVESELLGDDPKPAALPKPDLTFDAAGTADAGKSLRPDGDTKAPADSVPDASESKRAGARVGRAVFVVEGRQAGGLELDGTGGFRSPAYPDLTTGVAYTIDASIRPAAADAPTPRVVLHVPSRGRGPASFEVVRRPDRHLEVRCAGNVLGASSRPVPDREWTHVALVVTPPRLLPAGFGRPAIATPEQVLLLLDGAVDATLEHPAIAKEFRGSAGQVLVGVSPAGTDGFVGTIDEVRISTGIAEYCADRRRQFFAAEAVADAPPVMRDQRDVVLHESLDRPAGGTSPAEMAAVASAGAVRGECALVGAAHGARTVPLDSAIDLAQGAVEFWFRPDDWDNRQVQGFMRPLFSVPLVTITTQADEKSAPQTFLAAGVLSTRPKYDNPPRIEPGTWHHVLLAWGPGGQRAFLDGAPMPSGVLGWSVNAAAAVPALPVRSIVIGAAAKGGGYRGEGTFIDEVRLYRRPLAAIEAVNAFARFAPGGRVPPLPFATVDWGLNIVGRSLRADFELLDPRRDRVARVEATIAGPGYTHAAVITGTSGTSAPGRYPQDVVTGLADGRAALSTIGLPLEYGRHSLALRFLAADGTPIESLSFESDRPPPPWWKSKVGLHEGEVPPGFEPVRLEAEKDGRTGVLLSDRRIEIDRRGWPAALVARGKDMLAGPVAVTAAAAGGPLEWQPAAAAVAVEASAADRAELRGSMAAGGWSLTTTTAIECDGMIKLTARLAPPPEGEIDGLVVTIPLQEECAKFFGFWTGNMEFRNACRYGFLPQGKGIVFASTSPWAARSREITGSFIPFVVLADDERGLNWFAENDRNWTKSNQTPAIAVERDGGRVLLRLTLLHGKTRVSEPLDFVFGLHLTPVRPLTPRRRSLNQSLSFEFVDGFSKQNLRCDEGNHMNFAISPLNDDFEMAAVRAQIHRKHYEKYGGYKGPILYLDRVSVNLPASAAEFAPYWQKNGMRYHPDARDCYAWTVNEWLRRKLIAGIYIDDTFILPSYGEIDGLAYAFGEGRVQPGFEFFDYREMVKRLRWLFHDNGMEPLIWMHMTNTFYMPCLSFADVLMDGETAFPEWGEDRDFLRTWPMERLRFNNPDKWGVATNWMFKIGMAGGMMPNSGLRHFQYQQFRALYGGLMANDVGVQFTPVPAVEATGVFDDEATFVGYWSPGAGLKADAPEVYASAYMLPAGHRGKAGPRAVAVIVNRSGGPRVVDVAVDPARLGLGGKSVKDVMIADVDAFDPPAGEDLRRMVKPKVLAGPQPTGDGRTDDLLKDFEADVDRDVAAKGRFQHGDHNFERTETGLRLQIRPWDYRLIEFQ